MAISKNSKIFIKDLMNKGFKVRKKRSFIDFLADYGVVRIIEGYLSFFLDKETNRYIDKFDDRQLMKFVLLDRKIANIVLDATMLFEQQLNTMTIHYFLHLNKLNRDFILNIDTSPFVSFPTIDIYNNMRYSMYEYVKKCYLLNSINNNLNPETIPLIQLAVSWSLNTTINFFRICDLNVQKHVLEYFNVSHLTINQFITILQSIRHFRNSMAHNDILLVIQHSDNKRSFSTALNKNPSKNVVSIIDIIQFFDTKMLNRFGLIPDNLGSVINKLIKQQHFKKNVLKHIKALIGLE
ncbi:hypothetical protein JM47_02050 [Ureaplasma diversum]|uniref:CAAX protease n=1 Tax=Ureaplasma diversum TaxID=42094 RepID=A0A0C5RL58_9BACT|nr:Abi family protein [Ureaplasma diversum]AJQ45368.1 hypothetical protein JM47_02050 [Ureaplasma diversum]